MLLEQILLINTIVEEDISFSKKTKKEVLNKLILQIDWVY